MADLSADLGPAILNLTRIRAGDKNEITINLLTDGVPWNLTGAALTAQARTSKTAASPSLTATLTAIDVTQGKYSLSWDGNAVRTLLGAATTWSGVWDLQVLPQGQTLAITVVEGTIQCELDVTHTP